MSHARRAAAALESGRLATPVTRAFATALGSFLGRSLTRSVIVPAHVSLVCVGGATIGGSGKSRVANACARALPGSIIVGHGYRAADRRARVVDKSESVAAAGDEALAATRSGLRVVLGPTRQAAVDFASRLTDVLILDGTLGVTGSRARSVSLLAVDADAPWGTDLVLPAGDLRAPRDVLVALADQIVHVPAGDPDIVLPSRPFGLFTALARPQRLVKAFAPDVVVSAPDHGPADPRAFSDKVTTWLATEKCALHLERLGIPAQVISDRFRFSLDPVLHSRLRA